MLLCAVSTTALAQGSDLADTWEGAIELPGATLNISVTLTQDGGEWSGTIDIPVQSAFDLPLVDFDVDGAKIAFSIGMIPGEPRFSGSLEADAISGTYTQSGASFPFSLARAGDDGSEAKNDPIANTTPQTYTDPSGRFTVPIPTNWTAAADEDYVLLTDPDKAISLYFMTVEADAGAEESIAAAWTRVNPDFPLESKDVLRPPAEPGVDEHVIVSYDITEGRVYEGQARLHQGRYYILLLDSDLAAFQRRTAQVQIAASGFKITAIEETDITRDAMRPVDEVLPELETFIQESLERTGVPGALVGIVLDGEVVYAEGFGVRDHASGEPMTPDTQVMIGSTGKSLTTLLMATLVDEGLMSWETPAKEILPEFKVASPELTESMTVQNLVCACTGVPRRDLEMFFHAEELTPEGIVTSIGDFEFYTDFGEAFQYSNQLVAVGGYVAAAALGAEWGSLGQVYDDSLRTRVLAPMGMNQTTVSFDEVVQRGNYALPHQLALSDGAYVPADLDAERVLVPVRPAGAHWSTLNDMARYMTTLLREGVTPDGERIVSLENLHKLWEPQVPFSQTGAYGLGWMVGEYKGTPHIFHGGNTLGFTSEFDFLPEIGLGIMVLTNAQASNLFNGAVQSRLFELLWDQPERAAQLIEFGEQQIEEQIAKLKDRIQESVDPQRVASHLGRFENPALGSVELRLEEGLLLFDTGAFTSEVKPILDDKGEDDGYVLYDQPLAGLGMHLERDEDGTPVIRIGQGQEEYRFTRLE